MKKNIPIWQRLEDIFLLLLVIAMLLLAVMQIVLRNLFDSGLLWADASVRILVLWIALVGAMAASRDNSHIKIDLLNYYLPSSVQKATQTLVYLFSAFICGLLAYTSYQFVSYEWMDESIAFANIPSWVCQSIMPFGFSVICLRYLRLTYQHWMHDQK